MKHNIEIYIINMRFENLKKMGIFWNNMIIRWQNGNFVKKKGIFGKKFVMLQKDDFFRKNVIFFGKNWIFVWKNWIFFEKIWFFLKKFDFFWKNWFFLKKNIVYHFPIFILRWAHHFVNRMLDNFIHELIREIINFSKSQIRSNPIWSDMIPNCSKSRFRFSFSDQVRMAGPVTWSWTWSVSAGVATFDRVGKRSKILLKIPIIINFFLKFFHQKFQCNFLIFFYKISKNMFGICYISYVTYVQ